jgi:hypothetical protein
VPKPPKGPERLVDLADNPKVRALRRYGRDARRLRDLYFQMLCYCWRNRTDGFVPAEDIGEMVLPDTLRTGELDVAKLIEAELVERAVPGYRLIHYLDLFDAAETVTAVRGKQSEGARWANHDRWHMKRNMPEPDCVFCLSADPHLGQCTDQSTDLYTDTSTHQSTDQYSDLYTDQSSDRVTDPADQAVLFQGGTPPIAPPKVQPAEADVEDDPDFTEFWGTYPRKVGKPRARKAWKAAMCRRHDPDLIIKAAEAYRDACIATRREKRFIAHPATWLNDERYNDAPDDAVPPDQNGVPTSYPNSPWEN